MTHESNQPTDDILDRATTELRNESPLFGPVAELKSSTVAALAAQISRSPEILRIDAESARKRRIARIFGLSSVAAAVAILIGGFVFFSQTSQNTALAFEQVIENVKKTQSVTYTEKFYRNGKQSDECRLFFTGNKVRWERENEIEIEDFDSHEGIRIATSLKRAVKFKIDKTRTIDMIDHLRSTAKRNSAKVVGEELLNGKKTIRYQAEIPKRKDMTFTIWVDPVMNFPLKMQTECYIPDEKLTMKNVSDDFKWDEPLKPELFTLDAPKGFQVVEGDENLNLDYNPTQEVTTSGKMKVQVLDSQDQPIANSEVSIGFWTLDRSVIKRTRDYKTNANGEVDVEFPKKLYILRIWAKNDHYVPLFMHWEEETLKKDPHLPEKFVFHMQKGTEIGGTINDQDGKPIQNVRIIVEQDHKEKIMEVEKSRSPIFSLWEECITDNQGRWSLDRVPAGNDIDVSLDIHHPDYVSDTRSGSIQKAQNIKMSDLRAQTATIKLQKGLVVEGIVRDDKGNPISGALIIRGKDPYMEHGSQELRSKEDGSYKIGPFQSGEVIITVVAKGWMPEMRKLELQSDLKNYDFRLQAGKHLKIRFVDQDGNPLKDVSVGVRRWRGMKSLYNHDHPNVLNPKIPRISKDDLFEWTWAPADEVEYHFWKEGYFDPDVKITADGNEHVQKLYKIR